MRSILNIYICYSKIVYIDEHDIYRIAVKVGILSTKYSRNQFDLCPQQLLNDSDVKGSSDVTAAKARNSVRQTSASVIKQRDSVTAGVVAVSVVKITISQITVSSRMSHCGDCV